MSAHTTQQQHTSGKQAAATEAMLRLSKEHSEQYTDAKDNISAQANWASLHQSSYRRNPPPIAQKSSSTLLNNTFTNAALQIQPNPAQNKITMGVSGQNIVRWEIHNMQGNSVLQGNTSTADVQVLSSGVYVVKAVTDEGKSFVGKLIINK